MLDQIIEKTISTALSTTTEAKDYSGLENLQGVDPHTPVIFVISHQAHDASTSIGSEPRQLINMVKHFPGGPRSVRIIVRESNSSLGRLIHNLSPQHVVISTRESEPDSIRRNTANRLVWKRIASHALKAKGKLVVALAPDAGKTSADSHVLVDPQKVSAGGVVKLLEALSLQGYNSVPILPVAFNHMTGRIGIGPDCSQAFNQAPKDQKPHILSYAINSVPLPADFDPTPMPSHLELPIHT